MKNRKLLVIAMLLSATTFLSAQMPADTIIQKMKFFECMVGEWQGEAEISTREGKDKITQHELVSFNLNGTILNVEGTGTNDKGEVVFNAFATIYYDQINNQFKMHAFKSDGQMTEALIEVLGPGEFIWSFSPSSAAHIKYTTQITDTSWTENGHFSSDKENWFPFFNMALKKL